MAYDAHAGEEEALSVSAALSLAKGKLEGIAVRIIGEVSELSNKAGYKAVYFTIKDKDASLPCMMWNNRYKAAGIELTVGSLIEVTGRFSLYAAKGRMNFDVFSFALAGEGKLRMQVAELARRLQAEGLMERAAKLALPHLPQTIGLVTSPRGAAVYDVLRTLRRRYPLAEVVLAGVPVEGPQAPQALIEGLRTVMTAGAEVILLVRGGGSFEDLMPFNDEALARTIAALPVPVVTGIGHEPDTSIADMVADLRASTPTAAAESVAPPFEMIAGDLESKKRDLQNAVQALLRRDADKLAAFETMPLFQEPMRLFTSDSQKLDELSSRITAVLPSRVEDMRRSVEMTQVLIQRSLVNMLEPYERDVQEARGRLMRRGETLVTPYTQASSHAAALLESLSPLAVLGRGYAIMCDEQNHVIDSVGKVRVDESVRMRLQDGSVSCLVTDVDECENAVL